MKKEGISSIKVAATYIGTIVGAGFATGQEIMQFFTRFGLWGLLGLIVTTSLFILFGYIIMDLGNDLHAESHLEVIRYSGGKIVGTLIDWLITFFLFGALTAMIAGTGALVEQQFNIPSIIGNIVMVVITAMTVTTGIKGVINSISFVVPFLLTSVIGISVYSLFTTPPNITEAVMINESGLITNWLLAAILYTSYNTIIASAVLGPLGVEAKNRKTIRNGAILGGLGLGIGSIMIFLALSGNLSQVGNLEVPMIFIAGRISTVIQLIYAVVLIAEVYTTAVSSLYGFVARIVDFDDETKKVRILVIVTSVVALLASQLGFSNLVKYLYPLVGYGGVVLLVSLLYSKYKLRKKA